MAQVGWHFITQATPGAPPVAGTNGYGNDFMNWLLVTIGGWARIYHNAATFESVFQMPGGSQRCLYVCHNSAISGSAHRMVVRGCESATGYTYADLVDPFPLVSQVADSACNWLLSTAATTATRDVRAEVWESGVAVNFDVAGAGTGWQGAAFGDADPVYPSDNFSTFLVQRDSTNTVVNTAPFTASTTTSASGSTKVFFCRSIDGLQKSTRAAFVGSGSIGSFSGAPAMDSGYLGQPRHKSIVMTCSGAQGTTPGANAIIERAFLPCFRQPLHNGLGSMTAADFFTDSGYAPGCVLRPLTTNAGFTGAFFQETNDWHRG